MTEQDGWFAGLEADDGDGAVERVRTGESETTADWPTLAVESGFAEDAGEYYERLREATLTAARREVRERERADDRQLIHAVRAMDDCRRTANELAERVAEWAGARYDDAGTGVAYARELATADSDTATADSDTGDARDSASGDVDDATAAVGPDDPVDERLRSLANRTADLADEADELERFVETAAPDVAPNLSAMAGPVLAARLVALSGGLESLAKQPSSTVQVLGAEDALFAHLRGAAPSPKHGVIFTHEYVRGTHPDERGSAARALAGKLTIAARVDHYSGERRPEVDAELDERIRTIRRRTETDEGGEDA